MSMNKFEPKGIKITHISKDGPTSIYRIGFKYNGEQYSIAEHIEDSSLKLLYKVVNGHYEQIANEYAPEGNLSNVFMNQMLNVRRKYSGWKVRFSKRGHSVVQAVNSIPYSQLPVDLFAEYLNSVFTEEGQKKQVIKNMKKSVDSLIKDMGRLQSLLFEEGFSDASDNMMEVIKFAKNKMAEVKW